MSVAIRVSWRANIYITLVQFVFSGGKHVPRPRASQMKKSLVMRKWNTMDILVIAKIPLEVNNTCE